MTENVIFPDDNYVQRKWRLANICIIEIFVYEGIVVMSLPICSMSGSNLSNDSNGISSMFRVWYDIKSEPVARIFWLSSYTSNKSNIQQYFNMDLFFRIFQNFLLEAAYN